MTDASGGQTDRGLKPTATTLSPEVHFLDTNAYALLLCGAPADADARLRNRISRGIYVEAVISELTSLEIHSVLGQLARGRSAGFSVCDRQVECPEGLTSCARRWSHDSRPPLRPLEVERLRKAVRDAELGHGPLRLSVVRAIPQDFITGRGYLHSHAGRWRFGSHDAVIAAVVKRYLSGVARFVTSDRGFKALLRAIGQRYFDPIKDEIWDA